MDKQAFFAALRRDLFPSGLTPQQVYRIEVLLDACAAADWPLAYSSYALATAHHETAQWSHMKEIGGEAYFQRMYDKAGKRPKVAATLGNVEAGDGVKFAGRGYVQLTGRTNYTKAGKALGLDLLKEPGKVEEPTIAARVLIWGMSTGAYTGKACRDYLAKSPPDYVNARRIINGTDKASAIAAYAKLFQAALVGAGYGKQGGDQTEPGIPVSKQNQPLEPVTNMLGSDPSIPPPAPAAMPEPIRHDGTYTAPASERSWISAAASIFNRLLGKEP